MSDTRTAWVIEDKGRVVSKPGYWTGYDLQFSESAIDDAVRFRRKIDAERVIRGLLLNGKPVEMEFDDGEVDKA